MATLTELQTIADQEKTQFNYELPDGSVVRAGINPSGAATVKVTGILSGQVASPIPKALLDAAKAYNPVLTPGVFDASNVTNAGGGTALYGSGAPSAPNPETPKPFGADYQPNMALTPDAIAKAAAEGAAAVKTATPTVAGASTSAVSSPDIQKLLANPALATSGIYARTANGSIIDTQTGQVVQTGGPTVNNTPTGTALAGVTGMKASDVLKTYGAVLGAAITGDMAKEMADVNSDRTAINNFFSNRKSSEQILKEEFARRGIEEKNSLLSELDKQILEQTKRLRDLPENIKQGLQDVGVTQGQLDRLVVAESRKPAELLRDLMEGRNALANDIQKATTFAEKFAGTILEDQAAKLAAMEWQLNQDQDDVANLKADEKATLANAVGERKNIMEFAMDIADAGAPQSVIDEVLKSTSLESALKLGGSYLGPVAKTTQNPSPGNTPGTTPVPGVTFSSKSTPSILDGAQGLLNLTVSEQTKVRNDLYALGFNSNTPPSWFTQLATEEWLADAKAQGISNPPQMSSEILSRNWDAYRTKILGTGSINTTSSGSASSKTGASLNFDTL